MFALTGRQTALPTSGAPVASGLSHAGAGMTPHLIAATVVAVTLALMAIVSGIEEPVITVKVALSSLLVSRVLLSLAPIRIGEAARIASAHGGSVIAALIMVEPSASLTCLLWQAVWFAVDFSRTQFIALPYASAGDTRGQATAPDAATAASTVANLTEEPRASADAGGGSHPEGASAPEVNRAGFAGGSLS